MTRFRFIDWVMRLPPELTEQFKTQVIAYEEERNMTYVTQTFQLCIDEGKQQGIQQGMQQGMQQGIQQGIRNDVVRVLTLRFDTSPPALEERLQDVEDIKLLEALHAQAVLAESLEKFQQFMDDLLCPAAPSDTPPQPSTGVETA